MREIKTFIEELSLDKVKEAFAAYGLVVFAMDREDEEVVISYEVNTFDGEEPTNIRERLAEIASSLGFEWMYKALRQVTYGFNN